MQTGTTMHAFKLGAISILTGVSLALWAQLAPVRPADSSTDAATQLDLDKVQLDYHPDARTLSQIVSKLQSAPGIAAETRAAVAELNTEANALQNAGRGSEARRALNHAVSLLQGIPWNAKVEFAASLSLRPALPVIDSARPLLGQLAQGYTAQYKPDTDLQLKLSLAEVTRLPANRPENALTVPGKVVRDIGSYDMPARNMNDDPYHFVADLRGVPNGTYALVAEVSDGAAPIGRAIANVILIRDIEAQSVANEKIMAGITGHDDTKASIRYPFEMIRLGHAARIKTKWYDYLEGVRRSAELLNALQSGTDLLYRARGDLHRHYFFSDANEIMPYRLYVPTSWHRNKRLPLVVALRGSNSDENSMMSWGDGAMQRLAEQYGYVVVAPLGYRIDGTFGARFPVPSSLTETSFGLPEPSHTIRAMQLSEKDTLNVIDKVAAEYHTDPSRTYITGNSQGGGGSWIMTARYPERFAAAAPCASSNDLRGLPFDHFKTVPVLTCVGQRDVDERKSVQKYVVEKINAAGGNATYLEVPNGTHNTGVEIAMPEIFAFFGRNQKK
jgi:poly(3-hydroxybutyrate) depolymerase